MSNINPLSLRHYATKFIDDSLVLCGTSPDEIGKKKREEMIEQAMAITGWKPTTDAFSCACGNQYLGRTDKFEEMEACPSCRRLIT